MAVKNFNEMDIIRGLVKLKWIPEILKAISQGNHRYSEILKEVPFISHTELNRKLALLVNKGVIIRQEKNNYIFYNLLDFGVELLKLYLKLGELEKRYLNN